MDRLVPWMMLKAAPGIGCLLAKRLLERFGSPEGVFAATDRELLAVEGISVKLLKALRSVRVTDAILREIDRARRSGIRLMALFDPDYPALLREIPDPPLLLYCKGDPQRLEPAVAVVGSRMATDYGMMTTRTIACDLAGCGVVIVSGGARGIDTAAHEGALMGGGRTAAVLGSGLERIYPAENRRLFDRIVEKGCVFSEFSLDAEPDAFHFPMRNRIISGLCLGTLVVEASRHSGSLITARLALEQNREVFAVPGNIHSFKSTGTHTLIKSGAKLVEYVGDILEELQIEASAPAAGGLKPPSRRDPPPAVDLDPDESTVAAHLSFEPMLIDELVRKSRLPVGRLTSVLTRLELKGICRKTLGNQYVRLRSDQGTPS
ncbi:MAG: DNA-processing protein DprA [Thermodesulfobacteriota bacterium]